MPAAKDDGARGGRRGARGRVGRAVGRRARERDRLALVPPRPGRARGERRASTLTAVLPKVEHARDLAFADRLLDGRRGRGRARDAGAAARADRDGGRAAAVGEIARASARLDGLILGYADLAASLGRPGAGPPQDWRFAQDAVLVAARAAGIQAIDGPHLGIRDDDAVPRRASRTPARSASTASGRSIRRSSTRCAPRSRRPRTRSPRRARRSPRSTRPPPTGAGAVAAATGCSTRRSPCRRAACSRARGRRRERRVGMPSHAPWFEELDVGARCSPPRRPSRSPRATPRCTRRSSATVCGSRSTARWREAVLGDGPPVAHPALVWDVGDRPVDGRHRPGDREPLLPRPPAAPARADRRHAAHDDRGRRPAREPAARGAPAHRARACCASGRSTRRTGRCSTSPAARCCRCATPRPASPATRCAVIPCKPVPEMAKWREEIYAFIKRNAERSAAYFSIPATQVIEIGIEVDI